MKALGTRVVVFEDLVRDQKRFIRILEEAGCEVLMIGHANPENESEELTRFSPDLAIVDCLFDRELDGMRILEFLRGNFPGLPAVVCTILLNRSNASKLCEAYSRAPGVCALLPKKPFPRAVEILGACGISGA